MRCRINERSLPAGEQIDSNSRSTNDGNGKVERRTSDVQPGNS